MKLIEIEIYLSYYDQFNKWKCMLLALEFAFIPRANELFILLLGTLPSFLPSSAKGPPGFCLNISYIRNFLVFGSVALKRGCSCLEMANIGPKSFIKSSNVFLSRTVPNAFLSRGHPFQCVLTPCLVESSIEIKYLNSSNDVIEPS